MDPIETIRKRLLDEVLDAYGVESFQEGYDKLKPRLAEELVLVAEDAARDMADDLSDDELMAVLHRPGVWSDVLSSDLRRYAGPIVEDWLRRYVADAVLTSLE